MVVQCMQQASESLEYNCGVWGCDDDRAERVMRNTINPNLRGADRKKLKMESCLFAGMYKKAGARFACLGLVRFSTL